MRIILHDHHMILHSAHREASYSGHVRVFTYSSTSKKLNRLGNTILRASSSDLFGCSVSMCFDGKNVAVLQLQCHHRQMWSKDSNKSLDDAPGIDNPTMSHNESKRLLMLAE